MTTPTSRPASGPAWVARDNTLLAPITELFTDRDDADRWLDGHRYDDLIDAHITTAWADLTHVPATVDAVLDRSGSLWLRSTEFQHLWALASRPDGVVFGAWRSDQVVGTQYAPYTAAPEHLQPCGDPAAEEVISGVTVIDQPDGSAYLHASEADGAHCDHSAGLTIPAEQRAALAAAILPAPTTEPISTGSYGDLTVVMHDSAFGGPAVLVDTTRHGIVADLTPDAARQLAAQLLAQAAYADTRIAEIEQAQDNAAPADRAEQHARAEGSA